MVPPSEQPRVSFAIAVRYRLEEGIGSRGRATIYRAHDLKLKQDVMLCIMWPEAAEAIGAELFEREMKAAQALDHPNIVPIHDFGSAYASLYYATPLVRGETLTEKIRRDLKAPLGRGLAIIRDVAIALQYAHERGMAHRDLKPDSIILTEEGARVTDWGVSVAIAQAGTARMREMGMSLGITQYLSPEQATGEHEVTGRSDIFALGCIAYEMLTGEAAFRGSTPHAIAAQVITAVPASPSLLEPTIPPNVDAAIRTAISKRPADRFATAADFIAALENPRYETRTTVALRASDVTPRSSAAIATPRSSAAIPTPRSSAAIPTPRSSTAVAARSSVAFESGGEGSSATPSSSPLVRAMTPARASMATLLRASASLLHRASMAVDARELEALGPLLKYTGEVAAIEEPARQVSGELPMLDGFDAPPRPTPTGERVAMSASGELPVTAERVRTPTPVVVTRLTPIASMRGVGVVRPRRLPWIAAAVVVAVGAFGVSRLSARRAAENEPPVMRVALRVPDTLALVNADLSPDGTQVVYSTTDDVLLTTGLGDGAPRILHANATEPFYSPDGLAIGFTATDGGRRQLRTLPLAGGAERILADSAQHGTWGDDGQVYFVRDDGAMARVNGTGGPIEVLVPTNDSIGRVMRLAKVAGTSTLIFSYYRGDGEVGAIGALNLKRKTWVRLVRGAEAVAVAPGYLVFGRGRSLMAAPLADDAMSLDDDPRQVLAAESDGFQFVVQRGTTLLYQPVGVEPQAVPVVRARSGEERPLPNLPPNVALSYPRVSPDGLVIAFTGKRAGASEHDIWMYELPSGPLRALPSEGNEHPRAFTRDGKRLLLSSDRSGHAALYLRSWRGDAAATPALSLDADDLLAATLMPDGNHVLFGLLRGDTHAGDLGIAPIGRPDSLVMLTSGPYHEWSPAVSPDGKWIAYRTNESGRSEVVIRAIDGGRPMQVTRAGGYLPSWSRSGRELYFESEAGDTLYVAQLSFDKTPRVTRLAPVAPIVVGRGFDLLPDDLGIITFRARGEPKAPPPPTVVVNFRREIARAFKK